MSIDKDETRSASDVITVKLSDIQGESPTRFKRKLNMKLVDNLSEHRRKGGTLPPIGLQKHENGYLLVWGAHRLESARQARDETVQAIVLEGDDVDLAIESVAENAQRSDLAGPERDEAMAFACCRLEEKHGKPTKGAPKKNAARRPNSHREVAKLFVCDVRTVDRAIARHEGLCLGCKEAFAGGKITQETAYELARLSHVDQEAVLPQLFGRERRDIKRILADGKTETSATPTAVQDRDASVAPAPPPAKSLKPLLRSLTRTVERLLEVADSDYRPSPDEVQNLRRAAATIQRLLTAAHCDVEVSEGTNGMNPEVALDPPSKTGTTEREEA